MQDAGKEASSDDSYAWLPSDKTFYYKLALLLGGGVVLVFLLGLLIQSIFSDGSEHEINPELADNVTGAAVAVQNLEEETFSLIALNDVIVIVEQLIDNKRLFSGTIPKNETIVLKKIGRIKISFTEGDDLIVEKDGKKSKMGVSGIGTSTLD